MSPPADLRRVVTKQDGSVGIVHVDKPVSTQPAPGLEGVLGGMLWVSDSVPTNCNNDHVDGGTREIKGPGMGLVHQNGVNVRVTDLAPGASIPMHRTTSTDINVLIQGELTCTLDDGSKTHLKNPGDTLVQGGTIHAWYNPGSTWARWTSTVIDAKPVKIDGKEGVNEFIQAK